MPARPPVEVAPGVHRLGSHFVSWFLVADGDRLTAVDGGLTGFGGRLEEDLALLGRRVEDVESVVLTHADADHVGLVRRLQRAGARVLVHVGDERQLRTAQRKGGDAALRNALPSLLRPRVARMAAEVVRDGVRLEPVAGAEVFADGDVLDVPGRPRVVHTPGHTPGHAVVVLDDRSVAFVGDALCTHPWLEASDTAPRLMPRAMNVDTTAALAALDRLEELDAQVLLPGHGAPFQAGARAAVASARAAAAGAGASG